jgi:glycine C-acetyltransferase
MEQQINDVIVQRIQAMCDRVNSVREQDHYFYNQPISELHGGARVLVNGREMGMYASYSYLGLVGHPRINAAAKDAIDRFGTGTHGVRSLAGSLTLHRELEEKIADFKGADSAITFSSGYVTNLTVISTMVGRGDYVLSDKLNHASIVDGCLMSGAKFLRFRHNDMGIFGAAFATGVFRHEAAELVVADSVFKWMVISSISQM